MPADAMPSVRNQTRAWIATAAVKLGGDYRNYESIRWKAIARGGKDDREGRIPLAENGERNNESKTAVTSSLAYLRPSHINLKLHSSRDRGANEWKTRRSRGGHFFPAHRRPSHHQPKRLVALFWRP